jgi:aspartate racemase
MKTLGILGGMGPKATSVLYDRIVDHTDAHTDQEHINTIILSDGSIPDRTVAIVSGDTADCRRALVEGARKLEAMGAEVIIMPCNTAHYFIDDIQQAVSDNITVLNMNRLAVEDALALCDPSVSEPRIGIMATDGTLATGLYDSIVSECGAVPVSPDEKS